MQLVNRRRNQLAISDKLVLLWELFTRLLLMQPYDLSSLCVALFGPKLRVLFVANAKTQALCSL